MAQRQTDRRMKLDEALRKLLGVKKNDPDYVYYQPPESVKLKYDAVIYRRKQLKPTRADNGVYTDRWEYYVTFITRDPDSTLPMAFLEAFPMANQSPTYVSGNLYHHPFTLIY